MKRHKEILRKVLFSYLISAQVLLSAISFNFINNSDKLPETDQAYFTFEGIKNSEANVSNKKLIQEKVLGELKFLNDKCITKSSTSGGERNLLSYVKSTDNLKYKLIAIPGNPGPRSPPFI